MKEDARTTLRFDKCALHNVTCVGVEYDFMLHDSCACTAGAKCKFQSAGCIQSVAIRSIQE